MTRNCIEETKQVKGGNKKTGCPTATWFYRSGTMDLFDRIGGRSPTPTGRQRQERPDHDGLKLFSLGRDRITELPVYNDGKVWIEVTGTKHGVPNAGQEKS